MMVKKIITDKQAWIRINKRVHKMPRDYRYVYKQMQRYIFKTATLNGDDVLEIFDEIVSLLEQGITNNQHILDVTGRDVAHFCDVITADKPSYLDEVTLDIERSLKAAVLKSSKKTPI